MRRAIRRLCMKGLRALPELAFAKASPDSLKKKGAVDGVQSAAGAALTKQSALYIYTRRCQTSSHAFEVVT